MLCIFFHHVEVVKVKWELRWLESQVKTRTSIVKEEKRIEPLEEIIKDNCVYHCHFLQFGKAMSFNYENVFYTMAGSQSKASLKLS